MTELCLKVNGYTMASSESLARYLTEIQKQASMFLTNTEIKIAVLVSVWNVNIFRSSSFVVELAE